MGETISSTIAQQTTALSTATTAQTDVTLPVLLTQLPEALAEVSRPLSINGTIIGMLAGDEITLRTSLGLLTLTLAEADKEAAKILAQFVKATPAGSALVDLFVEKGSPPQKAVLVLHTQDKPAALPPLQPPALSDAPRAASAALPSAPIHAPLQTGKPLSISHVFLPQETALADTHRGVVAKAALSTPQASPAQPAAQPHEAIIQTYASLQGQPEPASPLRLVVHRIVSNPSIELPHAPSPTNAPMPAILVAKTQAGQPFIQTEKGTFVLSEPTSFAVGTKLVVSLVKESAAPAPLSLQPLEMEPLQLLQQYIDTLTATAMPNTPSATPDKVPTIQHHFAGTLLFFLSAMQAGKLESWLPAPPLGSVHAVKSGKAPIKEALLDALGDVLSTPSYDGKVGEWQSYPVPVNIGGNAHLFHLHVAHEDGQGGSGPNAAAKVRKTRFIVSMDMSRLGAMQLDGLAQPKTLDLVLRSETELPAVLIGDIRATALASFEAIGLKGSILFQSGPANWIRFQERTNALGVEV